MKKAIFALADSQQHADRLVRSLQEGGFRKDEISVLYSKEEEPGVYREENEFGEMQEVTNKPKKGKRSKEGTAPKTNKEGQLTGTIGTLPNAGPYTLPDYGTFFAAGPIVTAFGKTNTRSPFGPIVATFVEFGIPESDAKKFEGRLKRGGVLVGVYARNSEFIDVATDLFEKGHATDVAISSERAGTR